MSAKLTIGFLGAGKMATALARGLIRAKLAEPANLFASDPIAAARDSFAKETGGKSAASNIEVVKSAKVIFLSVKPDQTAAVLGEVRDSFSAEHLLISIAAGVPIAKLEAALPAGAPPSWARVASAWRCAAVTRSRAALTSCCAWSKAAWVVTPRRRRSC